MSEPITIPNILAGRFVPLRLRCGSGGRQWEPLPAEPLKNLELSLAFAHLAASAPSSTLLTPNYYYESSLTSHADVQRLAGPSAQMGGLLALASHALRPRGSLGPNEMWATGTLPADLADPCPVYVTDFEAKLCGFHTSAGARIFLCPSANRDREKHDAQGARYALSGGTTRGTIRVWTCEQLRAWITSGSSMTLPPKVLVFVESIPDLLEGIFMVPSAAARSRVSQSDTEGSASVVLGVGRSLIVPFRWPDEQAELGAAALGPGPDEYRSGRVHVPPEAQRIVA